MPGGEGHDNVVDHCVWLFEFSLTNDIDAPDVPADGAQRHGQQAEGARGIGHTDTHEERHRTDISAT